MCTKNKSLEQTSVERQARFTACIIPRNQQVTKMFLLSSGWTMGGMPFSVLYMNPKGQMSARSPMTEPLRGFPPTFDNSEALQQRDAAPADNIAPDAQALSSGTGNSSPTSIPTRRQYSIIPQLFVSYGWGPLGKRDD